MADRITLYISAAFDLEIERDLLARAVTEIPVTLGWEISMTPHPGEPVHHDKVARADVHILLMGSDIRAPMGVEWMAAKRAGKTPVSYMKKGIRRTPAAHQFIRHIQRSTEWRLFEGIGDLRHQALLLLADHILDRAIYFSLRPAELETLQSWREELESKGATAVEETKGGAGESSVILTTERYTPSDGVLIQPESEKENQPEKRDPQ